MEATAAEQMKCRKCQGRTFLDRVFSDNKNFETSCLLCGKREFIPKDSELGQWLDKKERALRLAGNLSSIST